MIWSRGRSRGCVVSHRRDMIWCIWLWCLRKATHIMSDIPPTGICSMGEGPVKSCMMFSGMVAKDAIVLGFVLEG